MPRSTAFRLSVWMVAVLILALSLQSAVVPGAAAQMPSGPTDVILATTTSTQDSGLLDVLVPLFAEQSGYNLKPIAVGSGAAIALGEKGEADVLLVHSPRDEATFMDAGYGVDRHMVMYNDFVVVGPADDPAVIEGLPATEAMTAIAESESTFVSRGDDSGTHKLELGLWERIGLVPEGGWYVESGTGMGDTLNLANERDGYTITDRGTYLALQDRLDLVVLVEGDPLLLNVYHVIAVNPDRYDTINAPGARAFIDFLLDPATQQVIGEFGVEEFGQPLFTPCADNACDVVPATPVAGGRIPAPVGARFIAPWFSVRLFAIGPGRDESRPYKRVLVAGAGLRG